MLKKTRFRILLGIGIICFVLVSIIIVNVLFHTQYNSKGISRLVGITIDRSHPKELVYQNSKSSVYTFHLKEADLEKIDANRINLHDALSTNQISIQELISACKLYYDKNNIKKYKAENYQIISVNNEYIIAPLDIFDEDLGIH